MFVDYSQAPDAVTILRFVGNSTVLLPFIMSAQVLASLVAAYAFVCFE